jgi:signal transduction histidine kinase
MDSKHPERQAPSEACVEAGGCLIPWALLHGLARALFEAATTDQALGRTVDLVRCHGQAPSAAVLHVDGGARFLRPIRSAGLSADFRGRYRLRPGEGAEGAAFRLKRPAWAALAPAPGDDRPVEAEPHRRILEAEGIRAVVAAPLRRRGEPAGAVAGYYRDLPPAPRGEAALVGMIADLASLALDRGRAIETALEGAALTGVRRLAAAVSHELNTPLATILGTVRLLLRRGAGWPVPDVALRDRPPDGQALAAIQTAGQEIADVLRRVQRVDRYRVTDYIAGEQMIDLDAAVVEDERARRPRQTLAGCVRRA